MKRRLSVRGVVWQNDKLLCVKLKGHRSSPESNYWCTPGGGIEEGEDILSAMKREMIEETGIEPIVGSLLYVQQFTDNVNGREILDFFFHIKNPEDFKDVDLSSTSHGEIEIDELDFIDPKEEFLLPEFLTNTDIGSDINTGKTQFFNNL